MPLFQKARFAKQTEEQGAIEDFACLFYMVEGNMLSYDSRGLHRIGEKEAIVKNCNNYVQRYVPSEGAEECEAIAVYFYPELLRNIYQNEVPSFLKIENVGTPKQFIGNKLIDQFMKNLVLYFEYTGIIDDELGVLKMKELIMILLKSENHESIRQLLSEIFAPINDQFKKTIEKNIFNALSMEQLAFICHMSLSKFKREFKTTFNETPAKYIKTKRLEHAASRLLSDPQASISSIAFSSGFQDVTTFSSIFSEKYQQSPKKFRIDQIRN